MAAASQRDLPFTKRIDAETKHYTVVSTPRLGDKPWMVVRIRWSVSTFTEHLFIGGRTTRQIQEKEEEEEVASSVVEGPAVLRSEGDCRVFFHTYMLTALPRLARRIGGRWDEVVPAGLMARIVSDATLADRSGVQRHLIDVSVLVGVTSVYSEAEALLLSCEGAAVAPSGALAAGDAEAQCPICMEQLADAGTTGLPLPGCSHAFHRGCILKWFHRAPTCPSCRRDMAQYLGPQTYARGVRARGLIRGRRADLLDALFQHLFPGQGEPRM